MAKIKKNLSLDEEIINKGMQRAKIMFGGNFSSYISYLIYQDTKDIETKEIKQEKVQRIVKDHEALNEIDSILDM
ncbi:hypothetical protein G8S55_11530 [Clostridium botulinum C]|uniref:hypothetical protein n=1 Tax=Clostridium botulinum TaxID=1491 RepID=UPI001E5D1B43|nr:hypothetical protein [Clostridium botulinum]MCD3217848.1 hypothetical protein [Clostridium botulinum C]